MEPWDGPAALLFSDGRFAGGMLDRNGLRPARYTITKNDTMVVASEVGVMDFDPTEIAEKGRLQPGRSCLSTHRRVRYTMMVRSNSNSPASTPTASG